ncbi:MAG: hypothetical protein ACFE9S_13655 [Candidatus Hermodarchaeota archaeon]
MELKKYLNAYFIGFIGSIVLILSEFFTWFSEYNLIEEYVIRSTIALEDSFLYLFPLLSGTICLIASILVLYKIELKIKSVIIFLVGLGFFVLFFIDYIIQEIASFPNPGIGFYLGILGFLLILTNILNMLLTLEKRMEGN